jgi:3-oxoadipate enol-lactonase
MNWAECNGVSLRYALEGNGPTLVLVHEMGGGLESWDGVAAGLACRFRVLRHDQRGAGGSEKVRARFSLDDLCDDLEALLGRLGLPAPLHLVGAAMGAAVAVLFAGRRPERVGSLVLLNPATEVDAARAASMRERAARIAAEGIRAALPQTLDRSWPPEARHGDGGGAFERYRALYLGNDPHGLALLNEALAGVSLGDLPERVACPTLVLAGAEDAIRPPEAVRAFAALVPGAVFDMVDAAHLMAAQAPAALLDRLLPFYDAVAVVGAPAGGPRA